MKSVRKLVPFFIILLLVAAVSLAIFITAGRKTKSETISGQMKAYYTSDIEPEGNVFYANDVSPIALPEADERGASKLIRLPLFRQSHNFTCGVAAAASVLRYAGYDFDSREDRLLLELGATPENGTNYLRIASYLESVRREGRPDDAVIETEIVAVDCDPDNLEKNIGLMNKLRAKLDEGSPVICAIQAWRDDGDYGAGTEDDGHYVVLAGYKKDGLGQYIYYFMDPSTSGSYAYMTEEEFILRWHDSVDGVSKRIGIIVSYLSPNLEAPIDESYHLG